VDRLDRGLPGSASACGGAGTGKRSWAAFIEAGGFAFEIP